MSFLAKLATLFAASESDNRLIVALRPASIAVFYLEHQQISERGALEMPLEAGSYQLTIEKLLKKHDFKGQVSLVLSAGQYHIVQVEKPDVVDAELTNALVWQVKDIVPLAAEDIFLDYYHTPETTTGTQKINVVCASKLELQTLVSAINQDDDLIVDQITTPEFCFAKLLPVVDEPCILLGQQANEELLILIVHNGQLMFQRQLRGFANIGQRSTDELSYGALDNLSLEIQKSVDYFERQLKQPPISQIKVLMPVEHEAFIIDKLAKNTHIAVSQLAVSHVWQNYRHLAAAVGAAQTFCDQTIDVKEAV